MADKVVQCPLCSRKDAIQKDFSNRFVNIPIEEIDCPNCKKYLLKGDVIQTVKKLTGNEKEKLSKYSIEFNKEKNDAFEVPSVGIESIINPKDVKTLYKQIRNKKNELEALSDVAKYFGARRLLNREYSQFKEIIAIWEDSTKDKSLTRTSPDVINIMQEFAKILAPNEPYFDLAVGLGGIIEGLNNIVAIQDVNRYLLDVANVVDAQNVKNSSFSTVTERRENDSISSELPNGGRGLFFFDPPMGDRRVKPQEWENIPIRSHRWESNDFWNGGRRGEAQAKNIPYSKHILGNYAKDSQSPTEILFLVNFLLRADDNSYFIGLFPESILNRNNTEYNSLRQYLIENCLISAIKAPSDHVILIGQVERDDQKYKRIVAVRADRSLSKENINEIYQACLSDNDALFEKQEKNIFAIRSYKKENFIKNKNFIINLPIIKSLDEKIYIFPKEIIANIRTNEKSLKPLKDHIISEKILEYASEELKKVEEQSIEETKYWFENDAPHAVKNALNDLYKLGCFYPNLSYENVELNLSGKVQSYEDIISMTDCLFNLFIFQRLSLSNDGKKILINYEERKDEDEYEEVAGGWTSDFQEYYDLIKPENFDSQIEVLLNNFDTKIKEVYLELCKFWFANNRIKLEKYSFDLKDIDRSTKVLKEFGLVVEQAADKKQDLYFYHKYRPFHPLIDGEVE